MAFRQVRPLRVCLPRQKILSRLLESGPISFGLIPKFLANCLEVGRRSCSLLCAKGAALRSVCGEDASRTRCGKVPLRQPWEWPGRVVWNGHLMPRL